MSDENTKQEDEDIHFVVSTTIAPGTVELHKAPKEITRTLEEVRADWSHMSAQISEIIAGTDVTFEQESGFKLSEIEIGLAFNAKGKLAFLAEVGAEASIKLLLKRT